MTQRVSVRFCSILASNGVKFTERGHVAIEVSKAGEPGLPVLRFSVRDTGNGISSEQREGCSKFSQPMRRSLDALAEQARPRHLPRGCADGGQHRGGEPARVGIRPSRSRFRPSVPEMPRSTVPWIGQGSQWLRCLVVDNLPLNRKVLRNHLSSLGIEVVEADCGVSPASLGRGKRRGDGSRLLSLISAFLGWMEPPRPAYPIRFRWAGMRLLLASSYGLFQEVHGPL